MSDPTSIDDEDESVLGPVPSLPDGLWDDLLDRTFAADPGDADDSLVPADDDGTDDVATAGEDAWDDDPGADDASATDTDYGHEPGPEFGGHGLDTDHHLDSSLDGLL